MSNARFSVLQSRAVSDERLSNSQFRTLAALGTFGDKDGWCFPKLLTLATMLNKSRQAVSKDIQALVDLGYVAVTPQFRDDGSRKNNLYRLIFDTPLQPSVDTPKPDIDTHQPQKLTPINPQVDTPSTSEVDALTPHVNAPVNESEVVVVEQPQPNIFAIYEQEIGILTPFIADDLKDLEKDFPENWFEKAVREAKRSTTRVTLKYIRKILERWKAEGLPTEYQDIPQTRKGYQEVWVNGILQFRETTA